MRRASCWLRVLWVASGIVAWVGPAHAADEAFVVGACTHFSQGKGVLDRNLERIKQAGIASIRDEVPWGAVEREKGKLVMPEQFDTYVRRATDHGVNVLLILDYANRFYDDGDRPRSQCPRGASVPARLKTSCGDARPAKKRLAASLQTQWRFL